MTDAEWIASQFHEQYEIQAPHFGYETRPDSAVAWVDVPEKNKRLMVRVVSTLLANRIIDLGPGGADKREDTDSQRGTETASLWPGDTTEGGEMRP